ncbi:tyrosine-type recombinase/integrase [Amycolatopsis sp. VS8301801F10]|uniref:tyrosine-type recombinase/integrase n=1 Tax=Amycolatopsis sp. VS8301801F10 TaxID=2652442 RepID=UPI0038FC3A15
MREIRGGSEFIWLTSHNFRKTTATALDDAGIPTRLTADQLGHSRVSMTQDNYLEGRRPPGHGDGPGRAAGSPSQPKTGGKPGS